MTETIYDHLYWQVVNLIQEIKEIFPNHNQNKHIDEAINLLINARCQITLAEDDEE
jgi:hypothetical protein|tara:strand:+ start:1224 stop:1391 length:168 start_codon:yes stop_codon:yes gene_type:complete